MKTVFCSMQPWRTALCNCLQEPKALYQCLDGRNICRGSWPYSISGILMSSVFRNEGICQQSLFQDQKGKNPANILLIPFLLLLFLSQVLLKNKIYYESLYMYATSPFQHSSSNLATSINFVILNASLPVTDFSSLVNLSFIFWYISYSSAL
jgi:hypothetical protein